MVLKDVRPIIAELAAIKKQIPLKIDVGRYLPDIRVNVSGEGERSGLKKALRAIEQAPAIDAVEVVRCKECKYRKDPFVCPMCGESVAPEGEDWGVHDWAEDDGFCHKGERREQDGQ